MPQPWEIIPVQDGDRHVIPWHDWRQHEVSLWCWCQPRSIRGNPGWVHVHHALDRRELVEQAEQQ